MRATGFVMGLVLCGGCKDGSLPPDPPGAPDLVAYALAHPRELARVATSYDEGRTEALRRCSDAMELVEAVREPIDPALWVSIVEGAERSGANRVFASHMRETNGFLQVFHEGDDEITKRTLSAAKFLADQKGCSASNEIVASAQLGLKRAVDKRLEDRLREVSEAHRLLKLNQDSIGKSDWLTLTKQAEDVLLASYLVTVELPRLAHERNRLMAESAKVRDTLANALEAEQTAQGTTGPNEPSKKASTERQRDLETSLGGLDEIVKRLDGRGGTAEAELRDAREGCREVLGAVRNAIRERSGK